MKSIEVKNLTRNFGDFIAVNNISFDVDKAEIFGFLGPNGAGKTTTIRMLCGILKPTSGQGSVAGLDISKDNEKIKKHIGYMSQKFSLYPDLTVLENIDFFAGIYQVASRLEEKRKTWALETAGLFDYRKKLTRELPGGFKQRLALVCALLHSPSIIFLDEPTAGVDPISRRNFWDLIHHLKIEEQTTIFVTTHYMDEAEHCERIALIQDGRIAAIGSTRSLKQQVRAKIFLVSGEPFFLIKDVLEKEKTIKKVVPFGLSLHIFLEDDAYLSELKNKIGKTGARITNFEPVAPSLEDIFTSLMEK